MAAPEKAMKAGMSAMRSMVDRMEEKTESRMTMPLTICGGRAWMLAHARWLSTHPGGAKAHLGGRRVEVVDDVLRVVQPLVAKRAAQGGEKQLKEGKRKCAEGQKRKKGGAQSAKTGVLRVPHQHIVSSRWASESRITHLRADGRGW